ncbi:DUF3139 domain-containing protein [Alteribacter keqinensis]|uniref:DUF3139 domain-containing protein n=1 Tax=Alteribacter keqinensis TaxID=2483800 RepID=A0A3M7TTK3_9BACI|nr:DUF3139 domain-containing protein [Alteribacter keqinensis]RNA68619.1 DUF3139 domain-containing protein [Alteribacter keqinensis]
MNSKPSAMFTMILVALFLLIPPLIVFLHSTGNPITNNQIEQDILAYLEERGYSESDITSYKQIRNADDSLNTHRTRLKVVFEDEPDHGYVYVKMESGDVQQLCTVRRLNSGNVSGNESDPIHLDDHCYNPERGEASG